MSILASGAAPAAVKVPTTTAFHVDSKPVAPEKPATVQKKPCLVMLKGAEEGKVYKLDKSPIRLGRDAGNDIMVVSNGISRKHAIITIEGLKVSLTDLGSTNGTYVNTKRIQQIQLKPGDEIFLGSAIFSFQMR